MPTKITRRYPWANWFKRRRFTIYHGRDYDCHTYVMAQMVRNAAAKKNFRVSIRIFPLSDEFASGMTVRIARK